MLYAGLFCGIAGKLLTSSFLCARSWILEIIGLGEGAEVEVEVKVGVVDDDTELEFGVFVRRDRESFGGSVCGSFGDDCNRDRTTLSAGVSRIFGPGESGTSNMSNVGSAGELSKRCFLVAGPEVSLAAETGFFNAASGKELLGAN